MILDKIENPEELKKLSKKELKDLSQEIREYIIEVISKNGGHLASSLGVVELTLALHYVYNAPVDKLIWDVGHQAYAHKIITGRRDEFSTIRKYGGICGFPKKGESEFDPYSVGHSSTSLSLALGEAKGRDLNDENYKVVAIIGDGSIASGMALEALNQIGHMKHDLTIILNDNEHSISKNVGAMSTYLTNIISGSIYNRIRTKTMKWFIKLPFIGKPLYNFIYTTLHSFKSMLIPGQYFQDMGLRYFGPVDGHDIPKMIKLFDKVKNIDSEPKIIHVITKKGKGYLPAEMDPAKFHGIGPFDIPTGRSCGSSKYESYSEIAGKTLAEISKTDDKIIAITAAMKLGTGLDEFEKTSPDKFIDVGISEQHGITFAGALASTGMKPFISIYSTFLQRAIDQLIHDIGIMKLPIKLLIDRSGIVGDDGETHHGVFDMSIIRSIPNFIFLAPSSGEELRDMIYFASEYSDGPVAIRYPRGSIDSENLDVAHNDKFKPGKLKRLSKGKDVAIFTLGDMVNVAKECEAILSKSNVRVTVVNLLSIKPIDLKAVNSIISETKSFITLENGIVSGGVGEYILSLIERENRIKLLFNAGFPDEFVTHGTSEELFKKYKLTSPLLVKRIVKEMKSLK